MLYLHVNIIPVTGCPCNPQSLLPLSLSSKFFFPGSSRGWLHLIIHEASVSFSVKLLLTLPSKVTILVTLFHYTILIFFISLTATYLFSKNFLSTHNVSGAVEEAEDNAVVKEDKSLLSWNLHSEILFSLLLLYSHKHMSSMRAETCIS